MQDAGTIYFNDSADDARKLVSQVLKAYEEVLQSSSEAEQGQLQRSMGLKMEQLKAEVQELDHMHDDD
jgi:L-lactate utilization protein LutB